MIPGILTVQFATQADPESAAIRWASDGQFSHVDLVLPSKGLLGARSDGGVQIREPGYAKFTVTKQYTALVPGMDDAINFALKQVGKPYNFDAILDMILHRGRSFDLFNQPKWFCDELVYAIFLAGGLQLLNTSNPIRLTPWEVYLSPYWRENATP